MPRLISSVLVCFLASCGSSKEASPPGAPSKVTANDRPAPAERPELLPARGLLCRSGGSVRAWSPDGGVTKIDALTSLPLLGRDGKLYTGAEEGFTEIGTRGAGEPFAPGYTGFFNVPTFVITSATSMLAYTATDPELHELKGTTWTKLPLPPATDLSIDGVTRGPTGELWVALEKEVFVTDDAGAYTKLELDRQRNHGLVATAGAVYLVRDKELLRLNGDGKPTKLATFERGSDPPQIQVGGRGHVVAFVGGGLKHDTVLFVTDADATATARPLGGGGSDKLITVDGEGRAWFRRDADLVALTADGTAHAFPNGALPAMPRDDSSRFERTCVPIGGGFAELPPSTAKHTGTLVLAYHGASGGAIELCADPDAANPGGSPCAGRAERITGTLDATGALTLEVPTGTYEGAVQLGGAWYVTDGSSVHINSTLPSCEVVAGEKCTIEMTVTK